MKANRPYRIVFQRAGAPVDDGMTTVPGAFADFATEMADVRFSKGSERREAAQEGASAPATFIVLSNVKTRSISVTDRIVFDGANWDIVSNIPSREFNAGREIEATRVAA